MNERGEKPKPVLRQDFGPGKFGEIAYQTILAGTPCELVVEATGQRCTEISDRTVDFDVLGNSEFVTACGSEHEEAIRVRIRKEARERGREVIPDFSRNGWGRAISTPKL